MSEFRFDWRKEPEHTFLKWFLPIVLSHCGDPEGAPETTMDDFERITKNYTDVHVSVNINGIEVPTDKFFKSIENNIEWQAREAAAAMYSHAGLGALYPVLSDLGDELRNLIVTRFGEVGIELPEQEEWGS